jgi:hypothetical protein
MNRRFYLMLGGLTFWAVILVGFVALTTAGLW